MAEEEPQEAGKNTEALPEESLEVLPLEATLDKVNNQVILKDLKTGTVTTIKANIIEASSDLEDDEREDVKPLTADEFRQALEQLTALGLTFTADRMPKLVAKDPKAEEGFLSDEYERLQTSYPHLPRELSAVVYHALTGAPAPESVVGNKEVLEGKVRAVRDLVLTTTYRSEFFFKYSTKLPYFEDIDWEVVFKTHERNVNTFPAVAYALLLLTFHNSNEELNEHQNMTVAVDLRLVDKLIRIFVDIKTALENAQELATAVSKVSQLKDEEDATPKHNT